MFKYFLLILSLYMPIYIQSMDEAKLEKETKKEHNFMGHFLDEDKTFDSSLAKQVFERAPKGVQRTVHVRYSLVNNPGNRDHLKHNGEGLFGRLLLFGAAGNGKKLLAKSIAHHLTWPCYIVDAKLLLNKELYELSNELDFLAEQIKPLVFIIEQFNVLADFNRYNGENQQKSIMYKLERYINKDFFPIVTFDNNYSEPQKRFYEKYHGDIHEISFPDLDMRKEIIVSKLNKFQHTYDDTEINTLSEKLDKRTCKEVADVINSAKKIAKDSLMKSEHIELAIKNNPRQLTRAEIIITYLLTRTIEDRIKFYYEHKKNIDNDRDLIDVILDLYEIQMPVLLGKWLETKIKDFLKDKEILINDKSLFAFIARENRLRPIV